MSAKWRHYFNKSVISYCGQHTVIFFQTPSTVKRKSPPKVKKNKKGHDNYQMDTANDDIARLVMGIPLNGVSPFSTMVQDLPVEGKKEEIEMQKYGELDFQGLDSEMDFGLVSENGLLQLNLSSFFWRSNWYLWHYGNSSKVVF